MMADNVYSSLVVTQPPLDQWDQFVGIKKNHMNPRIKRPPFPHLTLLHPFRPYEEFDDAKLRLTNALSTVEPFTLRFASFKIFRNRRSSTLYLDPEESRPNALKEVHDALLQEYPGCVRQPRDRGGRGRGGGDSAQGRAPRGGPPSPAQEYRPHIGVGFWKGRNHFNLAKKFRDQYQRDWVSIEYLCKEVYLLTRKSDVTPFVVRKVVPLGTGLSDAELDEEDGETEGRDAYFEEIPE